MYELQMNKWTSVMLSWTLYNSCRKTLPDYQPDSSIQAVSGGYVLVFRFVRGDGVRRQWNTMFPSL